MRAPSGEQRCVLASCFFLHAIFVTLIQLIKVFHLPISNSTAFVLRVAGNPEWPAGEEAPGGDAWAPPAVESWNTEVAPRGGSSFAATIHLDALSADAGKDDGVGRA